MSNVTPTPVAEMQQPFDSLEEMGSATQQMLDAEIQKMESSTLGNLPDLGLEMTVSPTSLRYPHHYPGDTHMRGRSSRSGKNVSKTKKNCKKEYEGYTEDLYNLQEKGV